MIRDYIYDMLDSEISRQAQHLETAQQELEEAPEGFIYIRDTGRNHTCYQVTQDNGKAVHHNIKGNTPLIKQLLKKAENKAIQKTCKNNIKVLKRALKGYTPFIPQRMLPEKHRDILLHLNSTMQEPYKQAPFDPLSHKHETVCGYMVRSKSEVIIANALWHFGIPFNYEELFPYPDEEGRLIFPDFTIHCPDGTTIIWEHWGMLDKHTYCLRNAGKLYNYNYHNYTIGKNLIITQDDINGNCSTELIYHIIKTYILPHFQ